MQNRKATIDHKPTIFLFLVYNLAKICKRVLNYGLLTSLYFKLVAPLLASRDPILEGFKAQKWLKPPKELSVASLKLRTQLI